MEKSLVMKKVLVSIALLFSISAFAQKQDSGGLIVNKNGTTTLATSGGGDIQVKPDSVQVIMSEFLVFLQDQITVKQYLPVQQMVNAFLKDKEMRKPKNKK